MIEAIAEFAAADDIFGETCGKKALKLLATVL